MKTRLMALIVAAGIASQAQAGGTAVGSIKTYWTGPSGSTGLLMAYLGLFPGAGVSHRYRRAAEMPMSEMERPRTTDCL